MNLDLRRAEQLASAGRWAEVVAMLEAMVETGRSPGAWSMLGVARLRTGRPDGAADALVRAAELDDEGGRAWLNAAAVLDQAGRVGEAGDAARQAIALGFVPPEAHLLLGRALQGTGKFSEAEVAFRAAIAARPALVAAHRELAQLLWMRTGDGELAMEVLDQAIAAHPTDTALRAERARLLSAVGDELAAQGEAAQLLKLMPNDDQRRLFEAHEANLRGDYATAEQAASEAAKTAPGPAHYEALATAQLGQGDGAGLLATADEWLQYAPLNQLAIAYRATALRMTDDRRGDAFRDYEALVRAYEIDVPEGWASREAYLADLTAALVLMHPFEAHPLGQSARGGSQTMQSLVESADPAVRAFFRAIDGPIHRYLTELGTGEDPLRARNREAYEIRGCWSVWLKPGGFHVDHVHPQGWISSACYVAVPKASADAQRKEGWIRFGQPPIQPPGGLPAEHFVEPRPGRLVLFPAWMWHGTVPFASAERRLTVAFDVLPGR